MLEAKNRLIKIKKFLSIEFTKKTGNCFCKKVGHIDP